ncbi:MAG: hypothetical protein WBX01_10325 [Nitrososphaeraceae archaeon]
MELYTEDKTGYRHSLRSESKMMNPTWTEEPRNSNEKHKGYILFAKRSCVALFGIFGTHTVDVCPLNSKTSAKTMVQMAEKSADATSNRSKYGISKIIGRYHSALEHTFIWIVDAESAHQLEKFLIDIGSAKFNSSKIVPLINFEEVVRKGTDELHN